MNVIVEKTQNVLFKASTYKAACILLGYVDENDREFIIARGRGRPKTARGAITRRNNSKKFLKSYLFILKVYFSLIKNLFGLVQYLFSVFLINVDWSSKKSIWLRKNPHS